jgi:L-alanine-DL-glutamate epimerase-like enolase superfamily enzyme
MTDAVEPLSIRSLKVHASIESWPLKKPFRITGYTWVALELLVVRLEKDGQVGQSEAAGVYYKKDTPASMLRQIDALRGSLETRVSRESLQKLLPPGGARNALDCALWDLEAKLTGQPAWKVAGLSAPRPLITTFTCGAEDPQAMAATARGYTSARAIKLKLTGEPIDVDRIRAVREARPEVWLAVDANQGFTRPFLQRLLPILVEARVQLIEQPFPIGQEALLDGFQSPIPVAADESVQDLGDLGELPGRFKVMNIKLDKCGGLTEGLAMARAARALGLDVMVGNMTGTSLAMAPAFLVGQLCQVVDLDGPVFLQNDRPNPFQYVDGLITGSQGLWGEPT